MPSSQTVLLINGPNLNLLGSREPQLYGAVSLPNIVSKVTQILATAGHPCQNFQSNEEGALINWLQSHREAAFLILNPAAYTHTSIALRDTVLALKIPFIEVHLSNIYQRESFRHHSYFSDIAQGSIVGLGPYGYELAAAFTIRFLNENSTK